MAQVLPLTSDPDQSFAISLFVDGATLTLQLRVRYCEVGAVWLMTISDASGNLLLDSIPLVTGVWPAANILGQYAYLGIGSTYVLNASGVASDNPGATNLGTDFIVVWDDTPSV
jgi:hypothetical protein